jgi:hypothetical protein
MAMQNYAARDETIRINSYTTVLRREGVPHEVFATYWRGFRASVGMSRTISTASKTLIYGRRLMG